VAVVVERILPIVDSRGLLRVEEELEMGMEMGVEEERLSLRELARWY
jgi:hypothetical protein